MRAVGQVNTSPEIAVRKSLHRLGYRFRLHQKKLPGTPDIVLPRHRKVIFVNGCFWHGHSACHRSSLPKTNIEFWKEKVAKNKRRDKRQIKQLKLQGWNPLTVWQCEIRDEKSLEGRLSRFLGT